MGLYSSAPKYEAPDYAAANEAAVYAQLETLPIQMMFQAASKLGTSFTYTSPKTGEEKTVDFSGFSDADMMKAELDFMGEAADVMAKSQLDVQQKYGEEFIKQRQRELELSDPTGVAIREEMGRQALEDLKLGTELSPEMASQVTQQERAAQAARGNIFGSAPAAAEAMALGDAGFRMRQQRLANAASFLSGQTPVAQFGQISGAQAGASPFNPIGIGQTFTANAQLGQSGLNFALQNAQMKYESDLNAYQSDPMRQLGGQALGFGLSMGAAGLTGGLSSVLSGKKGATFASGVSKGLSGLFGGN